MKPLKKKSELSRDVEAEIAKCMSLKQRAAPCIACKCAGADGTLLLMPRMLVFFSGGGKVEDIQKHIDYDKLSSWCGEGDANVHIESGEGKKVDTAVFTFASLHEQQMVLIYLDLVMIRHLGSVLSETSLKNIDQDKQVADLRVSIGDDSLDEETLILDINCASRNPNSVKSSQRLIAGERFVTLWMLRFNGFLCFFCSFSLFAFCFQNFEKVVDKQCRVGSLHSDPVSFGDCAPVAHFKGCETVFLQRIAFVRFQQGSVRS
jgi:hypothetical protein